MRKGMLVIIGILMFQQGGLGGGLISEAARLSIEMRYNPFLIHGTK